MLQSIARIDGLLKSASDAAGKNQAKQAVASLDQVLRQAKLVRYSRNRVLADATQTWYKSWLPRVAEANGRRFLHELDDVKDHLPDRTVDMTYLVYRELLLPFGDWVEQVRTRSQPVRHRARPAGAKRTLRLEGPQPGVSDAGESGVKPGAEGIRSSAVCGLY